MVYWKYQIIFSNFYCNLFSHHTCQYKYKIEIKAATTISATAVAVIAIAVTAIAATAITVTVIAASAIAVTAMERNQP